VKHDDINILWRTLFLFR